MEIQVNLDSGSNPTEASRLPDVSARSLNAAILSIAASLDLKPVLSEIAARCARWIEQAATRIYLLDNTAGSLTPAGGSEQAWIEARPSASLSRGQGAAGRAAVAGRTIFVPDAVTENDLPLQSASDQAARCLAAVPLIFSGEVLGVLEVTSARQNGITPVEVDILETVAPHAATAIAHARLFELSRDMLTLVQSINDRSAAVSSVAQAILDAGHDLHRMLADALQRAQSLLGLKAGSIFLASPAGRDLHVVVHFRFPQDQAVLAPAQTIRAGERGLAAQAALARQPLVVRDVEQDALTQPALDALRRFGIGAIAALPMLGDESVVGVLLVAAESGSVFDAGTLDTLRVIADQLAMGIVNARRFGRVRADQEQFKAVISSSGDVVLSLDRQGRVTLANSAAQRTFGFDIQEAIGQPLAQATTNVVLNSAVEQAVRHATLERIGFEVPLPDESVLFCNLSPITEESGQVMGWVAVMQDITRFKETERMKSDMILTASHDLRNPANLTLGALDMLGQNVARWTPAQREIYDLAVIGARRIEALISDLLDLERIERRVGLTLRECNLIEIARAVVTEYGIPCQSRQQTLAAHLPETLPPVRGDSQRIYQVMTNLISNAVKYTPNGGRITVDLHQEDSQILFEVSDTGRGIPLEAQARIFERFYRVAGSSAIDATGTGLGLALVKTIVEQHGGRVWVTSQFGQGSTFTVSLPVWRPPARDDTAVTPLAASQETP